MTERELFDCLGKNVKIIFKDGQILEGFCEGFDTENDNAPRKASIDIRQKIVHIVLWHLLMKLKK